MSRLKLERARQLITEKKYAEAAAILSTLPDDPQAQKWLSQMEARGLVGPDLPLASTGSRIDEIKRTIRRGDTAHARELLRTEVREHPSAEAWYLAATIATSQDQVVQFLNKAIDLDPFHEQASRMLATLQGRNESHRAVSPQSSQLLNQAVMLFGSNGWDVKYSTADAALVEKKKGVNTLLAAILIVILGMIGSLLVVAAIASSGVEQVTFQVVPGGELLVGTKKGQHRCTSADQLMPVAKSFKSSTTSYAGAIALGLLSSFCGYYMLLAG